MKRTHPAVRMHVPALNKTHLNPEPFDRHCQKKQTKFLFVQLSNKYVSCNISAFTVRDHFEDKKDLPQQFCDFCDFCPAPMPSYVCFVFLHLKSESTEKQHQCCLTG